MSYKYCQVNLAHSNKPLLNRVSIPTGFYHKAKGLLGVTSLQDSGMLFKQCNSIHMMGMKIPLDIVFLKKDGEVIKCVSNLQPWKIAVSLNATMTLEMPAGTIKKTGLEKGMKLEIKE